MDTEYNVYENFYWLPKRLLNKGTIFVLIYLATRNIF